MIRQLNEDLDYATEKQLDDVRHYIDVAYGWVNKLQDRIQSLNELYNLLYEFGPEASDILVEFGTESEELLENLLISLPKFSKGVKKMREKYDQYIS